MKKGVDFIGVGTGAMIFNSEGKVFLARRGEKARNEQGKWDFPGGTVEFGEKIEEAIKREIKEEYDFDIEVIELLEIIDHILEEEKQHWVSPSFVARFVSGNPKIMEPEKCNGIKWEFLKDIDVNSLSKPSKSNFNCYIKKHGYNAPKLS